MKTSTKLWEFTTHLNVVDYIIENNIEDKLNEKDTLKILDPSCGSGVFLVKLLTKLIPNIDNPIQYIKDNIYGVDRDNTAVNLTIFSIYITLINNNIFKLPKLKNKNIIVGNFFDETLNLGDFDVIVGNPSWFQAKGERQLFEKYAAKHHIPISNRQIAEAFIPKCANHLKDNGIISLIVTSKIFYNLRDVKFRQYLFKNFKITEILDMTLARKYIFKKTHWPSAILTFTNESSKNNPLTFKSLKNDYYIKTLGKIIINDGVEIPQNEFLKYDWLFKTLLVGSINDYKLVKKL